MAVKYVVVERANPQKPDEPKKFYAQAKASGELTFKKLSQEIAQGSTTVSDTDVLAVLNDLTKILARHLADGEIVRLGDFGAFQISVSGSGADSAEKYNASLISGGKIAFRPGADLKGVLATLKYEKTK